MTETTETPDNPKPQRGYFRSGYYAKRLQPDEREMAFEIFDAIVKDYPELAENAAWMIQAQRLCVQILLADRLPPPPTPGQDNGYKISVSREKIVLAMYDQLGLTRKAAKQNDKADWKEWAAEANMPTVKRQATGVSR